MKIQVKPEGREGVFLVEREEALKFVTSLEQEKIHNFLGSDFMQFGCNWEKSKVLDFLRDTATSIAILIEPNLTIGHHLVGLTETKRYGFDVGKLGLDDLEVIDDKT
jgi:hypothetical protein